jgi:hypothetical protein
MIGEPPTIWQISPEGTQLINAESGVITLDSRNSRGSETAQIIATTVVNQGRIAAKQSAEISFGALFNHQGEIQVDESQVLRLTSLSRGNFEHWGTIRGPGLVSQEDGYFVHKNGETLTRVQVAGLDYRSYTSGIGNYLIRFAKLRGDIPVGHTITIAAMDTRSTAVLEPADLTGSIVNRGTINLGGVNNEGPGAVFFNNGVNESAGVIHVRPTAGENVIERLATNHGRILVEGAARISGTTSNLGEIEIRGQLRGAGTLVNEATGRIMLAPDESVQVSLLNQGALHVGNPISAVTVLGSFAQNATGSIHFDLGGRAPGADYDQLKLDQLTLSPVLGGTLHVRLLDGFLPATSDTFTVVESVQALSGRFANLDDKVVLPEGAFDIVYQSNQVRLTNFVPIPEPPAAMYAASALIAVIVTRIYLTRRLAVVDSNCGNRSPLGIAGTKCSCRSVGRQNETRSAIASRISSARLNKLGTRNSVKTVETINPPSSTLPRPRYSSAPAPGEMTSGKSPKKPISVVMKIGRMRVRTLSTTAWRCGISSSRI